MKTNQANSTTAQAGEVYFSTWKEVSDFMAGIALFLLFVGIVVGVVIAPFYYINQMEEAQADLSRTYQILQERGLK